MGRVRSQEATTAAREHHAHQALDRAGVLEQRLEVGVHGLDVDVEAEVVRRAAEALEVGAQAERAPVVQAHDLEDAVASQQALVGGGDARFGGGDDRAVDGGQVHGGQRSRSGPGWM